jgi:sugar diacid utilization regulator
VLRETLRAYFAGGRSPSSAASTLGVARQTVAKRLHAVEDRIGLPFSACATEIEVALRIDEIGLRSTPISPPELTHR